MYLSKIECLFRIHDTNTPLRHQSEGLDSAFKDYFSRFVDIREPCFITMEPRKTTKLQGVAQNLMIEHGITTAGNEQVHNEAESQTSSDKETWLQNYTSHLAEDISDDEQETEASETVKPRSSSITQPDSFSMPFAPQRPSSVPRYYYQQSTDDSVETAGALLQLMSGSNMVTPTNGHLPNEPWHPNFAAPPITSSPALFASLGEFGEMINHPDGQTWPLMMDQIVMSDGFWTGVLE